jgi:type I restriction enzyme S subunit
LRFFDWRKAAESDAKLKGMTLNKAKLAEILVYYPSVPEQQRIVTALRATYEAVAQTRAITERKLRALDDLRESLLRRAFVDEQ